MAWGHPIHMMPHTHLLVKHNPRWLQSLNQCRNQRMLLHRCQNLLVPLSLLLQMGQKNLCRYHPKTVNSHSWVNVVSKL